jgi:lysyl-tRNA synthetase class I
MSTSKGSGAGFVDVADVLSPRMLRFLMIRSRPNQVIDFDPNRDADILNLYAKHDAAERAAWGVEEKQPEAVVQRLNRMHFYTYPDRGEHQAKPLPVRPSFRIVALAAQATDGDQEAVDTLRTMGHVPAERGDAEVRERVAESKQWLGSYAPDSRLRIELNEQVPSDLERSDREKAVFRELAEQLGSHVDGSVPLLDDTFKQHIFNTLRANDLNPKAFFRTAYLALLGREDGPALSPFLLSMGAKALPLLEQAGR